MNNFDYIPLDQEVIDREVEQLKKKRNDAKAMLRNEVTGGNSDIISFRKSKRIAQALEDLRLFWCDVGGEIYANRHEFYDVVGKE